MKHWHCLACHHEWDGENPKCDWCQADGKVLSVSKPFPFKEILEYWRIKLITKPPAH